MTETDNEAQTLNTEPERLAYLHGLTPPNEQRPKPPCEEHQFRPFVDHAENILGVACGDCGHRVWWR